MLTRDDYLIEAYEVPGLLARLQTVLAERGVITVADYRQAADEARNEAHTETF